MAKYAIEKVRTPKGIAEWVTITGEGKENLSGKLQYVANVVLDPLNVESHKSFIDKIDAFWAENKPKGFKKKAKSLGYYLRDALLDADGEQKYDEDGEKMYDPKGRVYLAFKTGTTMPKGNAKKIKTYNAKAKEVHLGEVAIGNDSVIQISGAMGIYVNEKDGKIIAAGVTLYLDAIQIHKLVEYSADAGFEADEEADDEDAFTGDDTFESTDDSESTGTAKPRL